MDIQRAIDNLKDNEWQREQGEEGQEEQEEQEGETMYDRMRKRRRFRWSVYIKSVLCIPSLRQLRPHGLELYEVAERQRHDRRPVDPQRQLHVLRRQAFQTQVLLPLLRRVRLSS